MTGPNGLKPRAEAVDPQQHMDAAAAVVHLANQPEAATPARASLVKRVAAGIGNFFHGEAPMVWELVPVDTTVVPVPGRPNEKWALEGDHRHWVGYSSETGLPKAG